MTELEMYELWLTLREWANYNQLNQTIEKNWLSNSFNSQINAVRMQPSSPYGVASLENIFYQMSSSS